MKNGVRDGSKLTSYPIKGSRRHPQQQQQEGIQQVFDVHASNPTPSATQFKAPVLVAVSEGSDQIIQYILGTASSHTTLANA
jgi:hypothetical protein